MGALSVRWSCRPAEEGAYRPNADVPQLTASAIHLLLGHDLDPTEHAEVVSAEVVVDSRLEVRRNNHGAFSRLVDPLGEEERTSVAALLE